MLADSAIAVANASSGDVPAATAVRAPSRCASVDDERASARRFSTLSKW